MTPEQFREFEENNRRRHEFALYDNRAEHEADRQRTEELIRPLAERVTKVENWQTRANAFTTAFMLFFGFKGIAK
jgi:hypothetical protein